MSRSKARFALFGLILAAAFVVPSAASASSNLVVSGTLLGSDGVPIAGAPVAMRLVWDSVSAQALAGPVSDRILANALTDDAGYFVLTVDGGGQLLAAAKANGGSANLEIEAVADKAMAQMYLSAQILDDTWSLSESLPLTLSMVPAAPGVTLLSSHAARAEATSLRQPSSPQVCGGGWVTASTSTAYTVVGEYHTIDGMSGYISYAKSGNADSDISVAVGNSSSGPWSLSGTVHVGDSTTSKVTWKRGPGWSHKVLTQFQYLKQKYVYCGVIYNWRVIAGTYAAGALDGEDVSSFDHNCDISPYSSYAATFASGTTFDRNSYRAFNYDGAVSVFGATLKAQSGYSTNVWMHWAFTAKRILCGDNSYVTQSARVFAGT